MAYEYLKIKQEGQISILTISVPSSLNALNSKVLAELNSFVDSIDDTVGVLIITGDGPKSFVAGADIVEMKDMNTQQALDFAKLGAGVFRKIETLPIPVIAAVNGFALGGGCELAMSCDIRLASDNARFGQPEVKLGIIPGFSGTYRLAKLVGTSIAKELIFTGKNIKADEAYRIGLVNAVYPQEELINEATKLAETILANGPAAVKYAKTCIDKEYDLNADDAIAFENDYFSRCFDTAEQKEGMSAFIEKRIPSFK